MFSSIKSFLGSWQFESAATAKMIGALSGGSLPKAVAKDHRTLGRIAWHLTQTIPEMMNCCGLAVKGPGREAPVPKTKAALLKAYKAAAKSLAKEVKARWKDATLQQKDNMYGETWARGFTLLCLVLHQTHHRGQMTVLMRQAGLRVPGVYGPAKEDWAKMKMPVPAV